MLSYVRGRDSLSWFFSALNQDGAKYQQIGFFRLASVGIQAGMVSWARVDTRHRLEGS